MPPSHDGGGPTDRTQVRRVRRRGDADEADAEAESFAGWLPDDRADARPAGRASVTGAARTEPRRIAPPQRGELADGVPAAEPHQDDEPHRSYPKLSRDDGERLQEVVPHPGRASVPRIATARVPAAEPRPVEPDDTMDIVRTTDADPRHDRGTPSNDSAAPVSPGAVVGTAVVADGFRGTNRALTQLAWLGSALLTAVITIFRVDRPGLWADELATWGMTTVSAHELWPLLRSTDMVNGAYYVLMWGWTHLLGSSDLALRLPSVIAMTLTAALVAALGSRFGGPRGGLLAGMLFAVVPSVSRYGQEARVYALVVLFAALSTLLLARALDRPRFSRFLPYVLVVAVLGALNVISMLLLVAHGVLVLSLRRRAFGGWFAAAVVGAVPAIVVLALSAGQRGQVSWIGPSTITGLSTLPYNLFGATAIGGALLVLAALSVSYRHPALVYSAWAVLPTVTLFLAGHFTSVWLPRYVLFTVPAWVLLAATTLDRIPLVRGLLVVAAVGLVSLPAQITIRGEAGHEQDTRKLATIIANNEQLGDGIVYGTDDPGGGWVGRDTVAHYLSPGSRPKDLMVTQPQRTHGKVLAIECKDATKCLPDKVTRVWVVRLGSVSDPLRNLGGSKEEALRTAFQTSKTWHPAGLTLALLTRKPS
ncbi:hypothetical protein Athai_34700 [Actinocatenispora thailandica]|uniref:Glycosyltransferase RgtA/B/C/D-like domain-containing protein n=1 Tax=Actinocatenispora thailandica TaxID=227318 RepID=A0A7R7DQM6_9ACTN|nr:glycosyltransferase family 39 protein [Actinocatenispora thailandica]BCJ35967.1 hypothetical protein Athai_34700 [Actinocatenispora thailandica]